MHARPVLLEEIPGSGLVIRGPGLNTQYVNNYLDKVRKKTYYLTDQFGEISSIFSTILLLVISS